MLLRGFVLKKELSHPSVKVPLGICLKCLQNLFVLFYGPRKMCKKESRLETVGSSLSVIFKL